MSDFTTTFDNESFINSEISNNENIKSSLNAEEVIENSLDVVEETASELNSQSGMNSLLDEPMVHRYNGEDSDNIEVNVDNEKYKISATLKQIRFKTSNDFPEVGSEKLIYIANDTKEIFGWDDSNGYFKIKVGETYDDSEIREEIDLLKENKVDNTELDKYYTKSQVDDILASGSVDVDLSDYYKKSETYSQQEVNGLLNNKANKSELAGVDTRVSELEKDNATNKTNINNLGNTKADKKDVIELQNNKADKSEIPFVGNFITKAVNDLVNYYTKEETYTQVEVRQLVSAIPKFSIEVVTGFPTNPSETTIYLLKTSETETRNLYTEYIFVNGIWEKLGTQTLDLSGYVATEALNSELAKYYTRKSVDALLSYKADKTELPYVGDFITKYVEDLVNYYKKDETYTKEETANLLNGALSTKADKSELDAYVTDEELEAKGYLTDVPNDLVTETELQSSISNLDTSFRNQLNKKADASDLEGIEESINQVSNNVTGISQQYVTDAAVSPDGKTLQIVKKVGNEIKNVYFQGGGGTEYTAGNGISIDNGVISAKQKDFWSASTTGSWTTLTIEDNDLINKFPFSRELYRNIEKTTSGLVIKKDGYYYISVNAVMDRTDSTGSNYYIAILHNGTRVMRRVASTLGANKKVPMSLSGIIYCDVGDLIQVKETRDNTGVKGSLYDLSFTIKEV